MISYRIFLNAVIGCVVLGQAAWADELDQKNRWGRQHLSGEGERPASLLLFFDRRQTIGRMAALAPPKGRAQEARPVEIAQLRRA